jgi:23S rRNA pseudouridine2605 synthase
MSEERLQKILARAGIASRRKAEELIREGSVTINGRMAEIGDKADPDRDAIKVEGKRIHLSHEHRYLLLNKPKGVMSTLSDPEERPTVVDFIPPALRKALVPVGRLDYNTEGLLILTDDGDFAQRIAHPRYGSTKTYEVKVKGRPTEAQIERLRTGILLEGKRTAPAKITSRTPFKPEGARRRGEAESDNSWWIVELSEGRTRQIREMFFHIGHPVQKLRRVAIGPLRDPHLPVGALRELTEQEVQKLLKSARGPQEKPAAKKPAAKKRPAAAKKAAKAAPGEKPAQRPAAKKASARKKAPAKRTTLKEFAKRSPAQGARGGRTGVKRGRG